MHCQIFSTGVYLRRVALRTLRMKPAGLTGSFLGLLSGGRGSVSLFDFGHGPAPSSGIYPREPKPADLLLVQARNVSHSC